MVVVPSLCYKFHNMKNITWFKIVSVLILAAGIQAGCGSNPTLTSSVNAENVEPGKFQPLSDIPVPAGAKLDIEPSLILGPPDHWLGRAVLKVGLSANDAVVFYQNQMPSFGWELITVAQGKVTNMTFSKADRIASIQVESATFGGSHIGIIMSPRQASAQPKIK